MTTLLTVSLLNLGASMDESTPSAKHLFMTQCSLPRFAMSPMSAIGCIAPMAHCVNAWPQVVLGVGIAA